LGLILLGDPLLPAVLSLSNGLPSELKNTVRETKGDHNPLYSYQNRTLTLHRTSLVATYQVVCFKVVGVDVGKEGEVVDGVECEASETRLLVINF